MYPAQKYLKLCQKFTRGFTTSSVISKSHYDALGITPKATQADVKAAYYKLSMVYHPDKTKDTVDGAQKFRDITEAYEVLGNVKLRRLYDKGMIHVGAGIKPADVDEDPRAGFYRSREQRDRPPPPSGRTPIYDFDEWAKSHYGAAFARDQEVKRRRNIRQNIYNETKNDAKMERLLVALGALVALFWYATADIDYDKVSTNRNNKAEK